ncbi:hypothetical protein, partial [Mycobacterium intracellulare]|uniref:hypothetical protein n=1 Tax=Mycobacterium intracellulare TaxID=1767 RepID=UPI001F19EE70
MSSAVTGVDGKLSRFRPGRVNVNASQCLPAIEFSTSRGELASGCTVVSRTSAEAQTPVGSLRNAITNV